VTDDLINRAEATYSAFPGKAQYHKEIRKFVSKNSNVSDSEPKTPTSQTKSSARRRSEAYGKAIVVAAIRQFNSNIFNVAHLARNSSNPCVDRCYRHHSFFEGTYD